MTSWHCPKCTAPLANPPNQTCQACLTPTPPTLCRYCGARMAVTEDQQQGAHTMCVERNENLKR